jgi:hypothetical protein
MRLQLSLNQQVNFSITFVGDKANSSDKGLEIKIFGVQGKKKSENSY